MPAIHDFGVTYLQFGYGDIHMCPLQSTETKETVGVAFVLGEPLPIGDNKKFDEPKSLDDIDVKVIMQFDDTASLDVLIEVLNKVRSEMKEGNAQ